MKLKYIVPLLIFTLLATTVVLYLASYQDTQSVDIRIMQDRTDTFEVGPTTKEVYDLTGLESHIWRGVRIAISSITEYTYNPESQIELSNVSRAGIVLNNTITRKEEVRAFKEELDSMLVGFTTKPAGRDYSSVYQPVARVLNDLAQSSYPNRVLLLYSDLLENRPSESVYVMDLGNAATLDSLINRMEKEMALVDLSGIEVWIIHKPKDLKDESRFLAMSEKVYGEILKRHGATVHISASTPQSQR